jgi:catechol 2,3-dioxygenase-like lactoylglutathione lyase family enzyme
MQHHLRVARPVRNLARTVAMYCDGLGLCVLGRFEDHEGFDGATLGRAGMQYHFESTHWRTHPSAPTPTNEDLAVFFVPDVTAWQAGCAAMVAAGFKQVTSLNPCWEVQGRTFIDPDGYRVVLQNSEWSNREGE